MSNINEISRKETLIKDVPDREMAYQKAKEVMDKMGYNTIQEAVVDTVTLGYVERGKQDWQPLNVDKLKSLSSTCHILNLAQAKYLGLTIVDSH